jgi:putative flippase GtrA
MARAFIGSVTKHIPPGQLGRYLVVGIWNMAFAYGCFALFTFVLDRYMPASYMVGSLLASIVNITASYLGYKWFVFKTKRNYLREWVRCLMVYSTGIILSLALLPPTVFVLSLITRNPHAAPYIAGGLLLGMQAVLSFLGHKKFTFRNVSAAGAGTEAHPNA